jgi:hypothetical protein
VPGAFQLDIVDYKTEIIYDISKGPDTAADCVYGDLKLPNPFESDPLKQAQFEGYTLVNETFAAVISNVIFSGYDSKFTIAIDAYTEAPAVVELLLPGGNTQPTYITKYIEGEQPDNVFKPPRGMTCRKFEGLNKMKRIRRLLF